MIAPLSARAFRRVERTSSYWRGRWAYLRHVAKIVRELAPRTVLEIGPGPHSFVSESQTLDLNPEHSPTFLCDAGEPWPVASGSYDLVLGLQCWEHFQGKQLAAFREARRAAGSAGHVLLSIPYLWRNTNATHRGIGARKIAEWTGGVEPLRSIHVKKPADRNRLILLYSGT